MTETRTLLRQYAEEGSELAFQELVERYIDLVYSTALRIVNGDSHAAADVTQMVFVRFSQKAANLSREVRNPVGWLHRDTCYVAATLVRGERRRQIRERQAVEMNTLNDEPDTNLTNVLPILDDAINELGDEDREAIMLRFFEQQSFRAVGEIVGSSEDAARMRVNRALDKLQGLLRARGVAAASVGALATILGAKAVSAAPIGLAASVVKGIGAGATAGSGTSSAAIRTIAKSWKPAVALPFAALMLILSVGIYAGYRAAEKVANKLLAGNASVAMEATDPAVPRTEQAMLTRTTNALSNGIMFNVIDADSGAPLAGTKLKIYYFVPGQSRNAGPSFTIVNKETDSNGLAQIDLIQPPAKYVDVCVTAGGHVPMTLRLNEGEDWPTNYVMKLQPGTMIGGLVMDEAGQPVAHAKMQFGFGISAFDSTKREQINFGPDTLQYTDENGRWWSDMIPADYRQVPVYLTHPDFLSTSTNITANSVESASTILVLQKGMTVTGTVADLSGQPIVDATIRQVNPANTEAAPHTQSDSAGRFELVHVNAGAVELSVQADGFSPVVLDSIVSNNPAALEVKLAPGHRLRGRVVDESGAPIANAAIETEADWRGIHKIAWSAKTDADGKFEWNSAPADPGGYSVRANGFLPKNESLQADENEHEITLKHLDFSASDLAVRIRGAAIDADSGQPLDEFKVLIGAPWPGFRFVTDGRDGHFDFRNNVRSAESAYQIEIQKDGYAPMVSTNLLTKDGDQILTFELHKDAGFSGEVILPNGTPAADAAVFLYQNGDIVHMDTNGEIQAPSVTATRARTDGHGHFSLPAALDARGFLVIHDQGFAEVPITAFTGKIALQSWGRVEGKLSIGGHLAAGQLVCLADVIYQSSGNSRFLPPLHLWRLTKTDSDGNFAFDKVPPGERLVSQCFTRPNLGTITGYYETQEKPVTVFPGAATDVELGGNGRIVSGRAGLAGAARSINWKQVAAELSLKVPGAPGQLPPRTEDFTSYEAYDKAALGFSDAQRAFWSSTRGRELARSMRSYAAYCNADGSFSIPDVPPGLYELKIDVRQQWGANSEFNGQEVGVLDRPVSVPESDDAKDHEVWDLGTLEVPGVKAGENVVGNM